MKTIWPKTTAQFVSSKRSLRQVLHRHNDDCVNAPIFLVDIRNPISAMVLEQAQWV